MRKRAPVSSHPRKVASKYLLSGIARCGRCDKALTGQEAKGGRFSYYVCGTLLKKGAGTCSARYINAVKFEKLVIDKIQEIILTQENLRRLTELVNEEIAKETHNCHQNFDSIDAELTSVRRRLDNLYEALETKLLEVSDLAPRIKHLRQRQESLLITKQDIKGIIANKRVELADLKTVMGYVADLRQLLAESSLEERKVFIRSFVKEIKVTGDDVDLTYTVPLPPEHLSDCRAGVLSIVRSG